MSIGNTCIWSMYCTRYTFLYLFLEEGSNSSSNNDNHTFIIPSFVDNILSYYGGSTTEIYGGFVSIRRKCLISISIVQVVLGELRLNILCHTQQVARGKMLLTRSSVSKSLCMC